MTSILPAPTPDGDDNAQAGRHYGPDGVEQTLVYVDGEATFVPAAVTPDAPAELSASDPLDVLADLEQAALLDELRQALRLHYDPATATVTVALSGALAGIPGDLRARMLDAAAGAVRMGLERHALRQESRDAEGIVDDGEGPHVHDWQPLGILTRDDAGRPVRQAWARCACGAQQRTTLTGSTL